MKKLILKWAAKICYKLADKYGFDLDKNGKKDFEELGDRLIAIAEC